MGKIKGKIRNILQLRIRTSFIRHRLREDKDEKSETENGKA